MSFNLGRLLQVGWGDTHNITMTGEYSTDSTYWQQFLNCFTNITGNTMYYNTISILLPKTMYNLKGTCYQFSETTTRSTIEGVVHYYRTYLINTNNTTSYSFWQWLYMSLAEHLGNTELKNIFSGVYHYFAIGISTNNYY